jgi:hypothetical protein
LALLTGALFATTGLLAVNTNDFSLEHLARLHIPNCQLRFDEKGKPEAIVSRDGETLNLAIAAKQSPEPKKDSIGYWSTPSMAQNDALSVRQRCYYYRGSAAVYTNTIAPVYEREIKTNHGLNYPEALFKELDEAWKKGAGCNQD